jgi:hypothetical protein
MPFFKDPQNKVHFLEKAEFSNLLPVGCAAITDAEAAILQAPTPAEQAAIDAAAALAAAYLLAKQQAKADALVTFLIDSTPAQVVTRITSDITDLASARQVIAKLAVAISVLAKQGLR